MDLQNKSDEYGTVIRNKTTLVAQGYTQVEEVDFDETFAPIARLKFIRILLAIACHLNFKLYQMDVKSAFLNGMLQQEVYVEQPKDLWILIGLMMSTNWKCHYMVLNKLLNLGMIDWPLISQGMDSREEILILLSSFGRIRIILL